MDTATYVITARNSDVWASQSVFVVCSSALREKSSSWPSLALTFPRQVELCQTVARAAAVDCEWHMTSDDLLTLQCTRFWLDWNWFPVYKIMNYIEWWTVWNGHCDAHHRPDWTIYSVELFFSIASFSIITIIVTERWQMLVRQLLSAVRHCSHRLDLSLMLTDLCRHCCHCLCRSSALQWAISHLLQTAHITCTNTLSHKEPKQCYALLFPSVLFIRSS